MSTSRLRRFRTALAAATVCALGMGLLAASPATAAPVAGIPPLVVTEIVANNPGNDNFEYFEVHNTTTDALNLTTAGITFAYSYVDSGDRARDVPLTVDGDVSIAAGETVVFWLSYTSGSVDSSAFTVDGFRSAVGADAGTRVVRVTGQNGMANGGDRGVRVLDADGIVSWSHYPTGSMGEGQAVHFRLPADPADLGLDVLAPNAAGSPGVVDPAALVRPEPEPEPVPEPGPAANWPLIVTEIAPDHVGYDNFEFFEVHNTTHLPIDLAAAGYSFAYGPVSSDDMATDVPLKASENLVLGAGETALYWLSYTSGNVDSSAKTEADFRAQWAVPADTRVVRITGQNGMANTGARGIRVVKTTDAGTESVSWSHYPAGSVSTTTTAHFRIPGDIAQNGLPLLETAAATPGAVKPEALTAPEPEPAPGWDPKPDPALSTARLQVTELLPDSTNVGASDGFEFIELYNATSEPIDFADYTINYLYPLDYTTNSNEVLWPAQPADVVIEPGKTLVLWVKNGPNDALGAAEFNAQFGTKLELGTSLVEIYAGGMANGSPRGIEVLTNTGFSVNRAYYNMGDTDDTQADQGIRYAVTAEDLGLQRMLGVTSATPGAVQEDQVPAGLMIDPVDTVAPVIEDSTAASIDPAANFTVELRASDDVQVRTLALELSNNVDDGIRSVNLVAGADGIYRHVVNAADLIGKRWYEYTVTARDGSNTTTTETRRVPIEGVNTDPIRLNVTDGQYVGGGNTVIAAGDEFPSELELSIDGTAFETVPSLESAPTFVFEAGSVDTFFQNGVRIGDDVLRIFDDGIYTGFETIVTPVPLDYVVEGEELVVSIWAGTKARPEIDLNENNDDFQVKGLRLVLPDGRTLTPIGYDDPTLALNMGDSAGKYDFYDARFALPADAFTGNATIWDTTTVADGEHVVSATDGTNSLSRTVIVDNTAPEVTSSIVDGTPYQGEISIEAEITDAGSGVGSYTATLEGMPITLPYTTSSLTLAPGEHDVVIESTDKVGNVSRFEATFTTFEEMPTGGAISPEEGNEVEAGDVSLSAQGDDPTGDILDVSFREGYRLDLADGDVATRTGTTQDAAAIDREQPVALQSDDLEELETVDGVATDISSETEFPYQLFDVAVPADAGADALVRVSWAGTANANAQVILYALAADEASWTEVTRHRTTTDDEAFTLSGVVEARAHAVDGTVS
ncbi:lamin tail domain-containing protein, partial [Mycetocola sp.]|uniref:lamin tail domain-containing protein n=1 Tax=Mycetocola sp. TaxID=1871042 RepID=UPI00398A336A